MAESVVPGDYAERCARLELERRVGVRRQLVLTAIVALVGGGLVFGVLEHVRLAGVELVYVVGGLLFVLAAAVVHGWWLLLETL
jgi:hypothetical protein